MKKIIKDRKCGEKNDSMATIYKLTQIVR